MDKIRGAARTFGGRRGGRIEFAGGVRTGSVAVGWLTGRVTKTP
jgi:hypothetical protein